MTLEPSVEGTDDDVNAYRNGRTARLNRLDVKPKKVVLPIAKVRQDGGTQSRAGINKDYVQRYYELLQDGGQFETDPVVYFDGEHYWLSEGFHRLAAGVLAGLAEIRCEVRPGTLKDATVNSLGSNARNGAPRTDKDIDVSLSMAHTLWPNREKSERDMAEACGCSQMTVNRWRKKNLRESVIHAQDQEKAGRAYFTKVGKVIAEIRAALDAPPKPEAESEAPNATPAPTTTPAAGRPTPATNGQPAAPPTPPPPKKCPEWVERAAVRCALDGLSQRKAAEEEGKPDATLRVALKEFKAHLEGVVAAAKAERERTAVKDDFGRPVPATLVPVFDLRKGFAEAKQRQLETTAFLDKILQMPLYNAEGAAKNVSRGALQDSKNLFQHLKCGVPFAVCPACRGQGCAHCKNLGWMTFDAVGNFRREPTGRELFAPCPDCPGKGCKKCRGLKCLPKE